MYIRNSPLCVLSRTEERDAIIVMAFSVRGRKKTRLQAFLKRPGRSDTLALVTRKGMPTRHSPLCPPRLMVYMPNVWSQVVHDMIEEDPERRPSAREVAERLEEILHDLP